MANKGAYVAGSLINKKGWLTIDLLLMQCIWIVWGGLSYDYAVSYIISAFNEFSDRWPGLFIRPSLILK